MLKQVQCGTDIWMLLPILTLLILHVLFCLRDRGWVLCFCTSHAALSITDTAAQVACTLIIEFLPLQHSSSVDLPS